MGGVPVLKQILLVAGFLAIAVGVAVGYGRFRPYPEQALRRFHAQAEDRKTADDQLMCPLILAGPAACPVILRDIEDPKRPLRRHAIAALGSLQCRGAILRLNQMVYSREEKDYFRGDALAALWLIQESPPEALANTFARQSDYLGQTAQRLLAGQRPHEMTYLDAVLCTHE
jgi:hypothetical protein